MHAMHRACAAGNVEAARALLAAGADVDARDASQSTPLHYACANRRPEAVAFLLARGADPLARNARQDTALHVARTAGAHRCLHKLLQALDRCNGDAAEPAERPLARPQPSSASPETISINLVGAVFSGNATLASQMLQAGADANLAIGQRVLLIHVACAFGETAVLRELLFWGGNADAEMHMRYTPLLLAARFGRYQSLRLLLGHGCNVLHANDSGLTALHLAAMGGFAACCQQLLASHPQLAERVCKNGRTAMHYAAMFDHGGTLSALRTCAIGALDSHGRAAIHLAADFAGRHTVQQLLRMGANVNERSQNDNAETPAHLVARRRHKLLFELLEKHGADMSVFDKTGQSATALMQTNMFRSSRSEGMRTVYSLEMLPELQFSNGYADVKAEDELLHAAGAGKVEAAEQLLRRSPPPDVNGRGSHPGRRSALHAAVGTGKAALCLLLLLRGALPDAVDAEGRTPLHEAASSAVSEPLIQLLIDFGADPHARTGAFCTPLMLAVKTGLVQGCATLLPYYGATQLNWTNAAGLSALHLACETSEPVAVASVLLSDPDIDVNRVSDLGEPVVVSALREKSLELLNLLLSDARLDVNCTDAMGVPLLVRLVTLPYLRLDRLEKILAFESLIVYAADQDGNTALHHAFAQGKDEIASLLCSAGANERALNKAGQSPAQLRPTEKKGLFKKMFTRDSASSLSTAAGDELVPEPLLSSDHKEAPVSGTLAVTATVPKEDVSVSLDKVYDAFQKQREAMVRPLSASGSSLVSSMKPIKVEIVDPMREKLTLEGAIDAIQGIVNSRSYVPPGVDSLPEPVRNWRGDLAASRARQAETGHATQSEQVERILQELDISTQQVEMTLSKANIDDDTLNAQLEERDMLRKRAAKLLEEAIESGKKLWEYQVMEEALFLRVGADSRKDDEDIAAFDEIQTRSIQAQEGLFLERSQTNEALRALCEQIHRENVAFEGWRLVSEKLTNVNRLMDQRKFLTAVRREKANQEVWMETKLEAKSNVDAILSQSEKARETSSRLTEVTRIMQRRQLELEEACRYRDLLKSEGSMAKDCELDDADNRVMVARERYFELKAEHDALVVDANHLGRHGHPEVWRHINHVIRGGGLLMLESFTNLQPLRPPNVYVAEKDNRKFVLKARNLSDGKAARRKFEKELFILRRLRHPLILNVEAAFEQGDRVFLVLPYMPDGTLKDWLARNPSERPRLKGIFRGVCQAITFLHSNLIVHADLKLENILMDGDKPILSDFDVSSDSTFFDSTTTSAMAPGTLAYMAPELFEANARITFASDMYSFGCCIYMAIFGDSIYLPPRGDHVQLPQDRDVNLRSLLENTLTRDPDARLTADEALAHEWFRTIATEKDDKTSSTALEVFREMLLLTKNSSLRSAFPVRAKLPTDDGFLQEAFRLFGTLTNQTRPLKISFTKEKGSDQGGLTTSLFRRFFSEALAVETLFERSGGASYLPHPGANLKCMFAFGVAIARCLYDERVVELPLSSAVFKFLFDQHVDLADLESFDESHAVSCKAILRCAGVELLDLSFSMCGGEDVVVTDLNKEDFVMRKIQWELIEKRRGQLEKIKAGFWSLSVLQKPLRLLGWRELVVLLSGSSFLAPEMVLDVLVFDGLDKFPGLRESFIEVLSSLSNDDLRLFLYFVTEMPTIPFGGLQNPRGHAPVDKITVKVASRATSDSLPTSSVCFFQLNLPPYPDTSTLRAKLCLAIREMDSSFAFR